jgi:glycosyltransferase involved in cell wall biosynthesis
MKNIKIGLYLVNKGYKSVDLSKPEDGNPGIGGTQYNFITLPYYFMKYYSHVEFVVYANIIDNLPKKFKVYEAENITEAARKADHAKCDMFIYRPTQDVEGYQFLENLKTIQIKTIAWAHNTPFEQLRLLAKHPYLVRYINVSKEQYDMLRDHPIIYKADMIYNGFDPKQYIPSSEVNKEKYVTYIGSLIHAKGFHVLARVWKKVLNHVPDSKLKVIGSGQLYNRNLKLGKWGLAEESYENIFRPYLSDGNGKMLESVEFLGVLGKEKIPIMQKTMVGCPNPTGVSENCPGSAIEFQACGTPVVSGAFWGLLDTVKNGETGLLGKTDDDLINNIVELLNDETKVRELGRNGIEFVNKRFDHKSISAKWKKLFDEVTNDRKARILPIDQNPNYEYKQLSEKLRIFKKKYRFLRILPAYIEIRPIKNKIFKIFRKNR